MMEGVSTIEGIRRRRAVADLEPWLAGGIEVVGTDDREEDDCDYEDSHDAEPDQCDGESIMWPDDLKSQEALVSL
jgi:hypothetical protein